MNAREEILGRIRAVPRSAEPERPRSYRRAGDLDAAARTGLLAERIADYRAEVRHVSAADVAVTVAAVCTELGVARLGVPVGFPRAWRPGSPEVVEDRDLPPRRLDELGAVATGCTVAIAETGTIVLAGGAAEGRRALTLVPDVHVCVIRREQIVELVPEAIALLSELARGERRPLTLISGPSATSDIELSRVEGVHGPRTLVALIVNEEQP